jgi:hypothetical protein
LSHIGNSFLVFLCSYQQPTGGVMEKPCVVSLRLASGDEATLACYGAYIVRLGEMKYQNLL